MKAKRLWTTDGSYVTPQQQSPPPSAAGQRLSSFLRWPAAALFLLLVFPLAAADIQLDWASNPPAEQVTGYQVQCATNEAAWTEIATVRTNTLTITNIAPGCYRYRVLAVNQWGVSAPSAEVGTAPGLPQKVGNLTIQVTVIAK